MKPPSAIPIRWPFTRVIDSQAVAAYRILYAATGLYYVGAAFGLVDLTWPDQQAPMRAIYAIWLVVLGFLLVGVQARRMSIASYALTLLCNSNPWAGAIGELIWRMSGFFLMFMDSDASLSVHELSLRCRGVATSRCQPRWPCDLAVLSIGLTVFMAGVPKAFDPSWQGGDGLYLAMLLPWTHRPWVDWIASSRMLTLVGNYVGMLSECGVVFMLFIPMLRWLGIALYIGLFLVFGVLMSFPFIGAAGLTFVPLMVPGRDGRWPWSATTASQLTLTYDGTCGVCSRYARLLTILDVNDRLRIPMDAATSGDLGVIVQGVTHHGFDAFRQMAWRLPYLFAIAPLLHVPGITVACRWLYAAIAAHDHGAIATTARETIVPRPQPQSAPPPSRYMRLFAFGHCGYLLVFALAATAAEVGIGAPLEILLKQRLLRTYNLATNDIRPLPLFCQRHLFGIFVYRWQGITDSGSTIELLPVFTPDARPGPDWISGPRYLQGLMFRVTDDATKMAKDPTYRPSGKQEGYYRAAAQHAVRHTLASVKEVRMLIKILNPPRHFAGHVAPWDREPWIPWLRYHVENTLVVGSVEFLSTPPRPAFTGRK